MAVIEEFARPKVNLTLRVLGRRADGYHELKSLVAFAGSPVDIIRFEPGTPVEVKVIGAFGSAIATENLVLQTLKLASIAAPELTLGAVTLEKHLPVAAGIGGGSADAAATLRAIRRAHENSGVKVDWPEIARCLGADVNVCLENRAAWMSGVGEIVSPLSRRFELHAVLVNPLKPVPLNKTAEVFRKLAAPPLGGGAETTAPQVDIESAPDILDAIARAGNDLQPPAMSLMPDISIALDAVATTDRCVITRMSGAGPTVFGLYATRADAQLAERQLRDEHKNWWIVATTLA